MKTKEGKKMEIRTEENEIVEKQEEKVLEEPKDCKGCTAINCFACMIG